MDLKKRLAMERARVLWFEENEFVMRFVVV